ncbi:MAG: hypothetical protein CR993_05850, partial [Rhodobacterales bacterium]
MTGFHEDPGLQRRPGPFDLKCYLIHNLDTHTAGQGNRFNRREMVTSETMQEHNSAGIKAHNKVNKSQQTLFAFGVETMTSENWIEFEGRKYNLKEGEKALDAMLRQGAPISFSCRQGTCRSCMLQALSGDPGAAAVSTLPPDYRDRGFFLPCMATDVDSVVAQRPDLSQCVQEATVADKTYTAPDIVILRLEPATEIQWQPGQVISLMNANDDVRSYSLVSGKDDYFMELHIRIYPEGAVSSWVDSLSVGDAVRFQGPTGEFIYDDSMADRPLLLIGTGTGGGVLTGLVKQALAKGHRGPIHLYHGGRTAGDLYLSEHLADFPADRVTITQAASREAVGEQPPARVAELAFDQYPDLTETHIFLCGNPDMIENARVHAMGNGADLTRLHADSFNPPGLYQTNEDEKLASIKPDPEMWQALGEGRILSEILTEFYTGLFEDPRLAPFFQRTTKQRAIDKQFSFLQDLFCGTKLFFGEKPFNSHHWMVISDELFDYRERMFFDVVRKYGIEERFIHR